MDTFGQTSDNYSKQEHLRDAFHFPGMRIFQFEFTDFNPHEYHPEHKPENQIAYTDTHDNNTLIGWFGELPEKEQELIKIYLHSDGTEINWDFIRYAYKCQARWVIVPLQDFLGLGTEGRINVPGLAEGNWGWRFRDGVLTPELAKRIKSETAKTKRCHGSKLWFHYSKTAHTTVNGSLADRLATMEVSTKK
jgi:4-alpha-glucanotransferase